MIRTNTKCVIENLPGKSKFAIIIQNFNKDRKQKKKKKILSILLEYLNVWVHSIIEISFSSTDFHKSKSSWLDFYLLA